MTRDIVIVGGGPAGVTTALALAAISPKLRERIVILEKGIYPRDKYCAGGLGGRGIKILEQLRAMPDVPFVPIHGVSFRGYGGALTTRLEGIGRVVRRIEFDHALAQTALARGIAIEEGIQVTGIGLSRQGVSLATSSGPREATVVLGADGVGSIVRKSLGLSRGELSAQVLELDTPPVASDRDRGVVHFDASDSRIRGYTWDFPTVVAGEPMVCRGIYALRTEGSEIDIKALFSERLAGLGLDISRYKNKRFAERGYDPHETLGDSRRMLVGEAAGIDPVTGEGIAQAIEYGAEAARFLARQLDARGPVDLRAWTREFKRSRLSIDLRVRRKIVPLFYGGTRPAIERFLLREPDALYLGCQHFGAMGYDRERLAIMAVKAGAFVASRMLRTSGSPD